MTTDITTEPPVVDAVSDLPDDDPFPFTAPEPEVVDATVDAPVEPEEGPYVFETEAWLPPKRQAAPEVVNPFLAIVERKLAEGLPNEIAVVFQASPEKLTEIRRQLQAAAGDRATAQVRTQSLVDDEGVVREDMVKVRFRLIGKQRRSTRTEKPAVSEPAEGKQD